MSKETTKKEALAKADTVKSKSDLKDLIVQEAINLAEGKVHNIQLLMAYARRLKSIK